MYLLGDIISSVPLKYPACDRRVARDRRVVAGGAAGGCRGGANEDGTIVIPLLLEIIPLLADNNCDRSAASGRKIGASSRAAEAALDDDGGFDDVVSDSCDDGTGEGVVVKPKPTRVDWDLGCFFFILRAFRKLQLKLYSNLAMAVLIIQ